MPVAWRAAADRLFELGMADPRGTQPLDARLTMGPFRPPAFAFERGGERHAILANGLVVTLPRAVPEVSLEDLAEGSLRRLRDAEGCQRYILDAVLMYRAGAPVPLKHCASLLDDVDDPASFVVHQWTKAVVTMASALYLGEGRGDSAEYVALARHLVEEPAVTLEGPSLGCLEALERGLQQPVQETVVLSGLTDDEKVQAMLAALRSRLPDGWEGELVGLLAELIDPLLALTQETPVPSGGPNIFGTCFVKSTAVVALEVLERLSFGAVPEFSEGLESLEAWTAPEPQWVERARAALRVSAALTPERRLYLWLTSQNNSDDDVAFRSVDLVGRSWNGTYQSAIFEALDRDVLRSFSQPSLAAALLARAQHADPGREAWCALIHAAASFEPTSIRRPLRVELSRPENSLCSGLVYGWRLKLGDRRALSEFAEWLVGPDFKRNLPLAMELIEGPRNLRLLDRTLGQALETRLRSEQPGRLAASLRPLHRTPALVALPSVKGALTQLLEDERPMGVVEAVSPTMLELVEGSALWSGGWSSGDSNQEYEVGSRHAVRVQDRVAAELSFQMLSDTLPEGWPSFSLTWTIEQRDETLASMRRWLAEATAP